MRDLNWRIVGMILTIIIMAFFAWIIWREGMGLIQ
jgi:hypothetical protein